MKYFLAFLISITYLNKINEDIFVKQSIAECPIFQQIIANNPKVDKKIAKKLSNYIRKYAFKYNMNPYRAVAVAMQESGYRNIVTKKDNKPFDLGIFQINISTAKEFNLNTKKIITDMEYAVKSYFIIMKNKKDICKKLKKDAWVCYHSKTPSLRERYKKLVNRYYPKDGIK